MTRQTVCYIVTWFAVNPGSSLIAQTPAPSAPVIQPFQPFSGAVIPQPGVGMQTGAKSGAELIFDQQGRLAGTMHGADRPVPPPAGDMRYSTYQTAYDALRKELSTSSPVGATSGYHGKYRFADLSRTATASDQQRYRDAAELLDGMLTGKVPIDLIKAVAAMEKPALKDAMSEEEYRRVIDRLCDVVRTSMWERGWDLEDPIQVHRGLQLLYQDTITDPQTERLIPPMRYDFNDFYGDVDMGNVTVGKLLKTGEGQCRSLPLLYLLMADRMRAEAWWAFSPNHSYVKFRDPQGTFWNFECTNGALASDQFIAQSGYVTREAIANRMYLDTVGNRSIVAHLLAELAMDYEQQFGYDEPFMEHCLLRALEFYPNDMGAWLELSNLRTAYLDRKAQEAGAPPFKDFGKFPELSERLAALRALYKRVDDLGYREMPADAYETWIRSVEAEKEKRAAEKKPLIQVASPKR